jgi:hypothetical protein
MIEYLLSRTVGSAGGRGMIPVILNGCRIHDNGD